MERRWRDWRLRSTKTATFGWAQGKRAWMKRRNENGGQKHTTRLL